MGWGKDGESGWAGSHGVSWRSLTVAVLALTRPAPGQRFSYTITVVNNGPSAARDVMITDAASHEHLEGGLRAVPPGAEACPVLGISFRCEVEILLPGERFTITVPVRVRPHTPDGTRITDTARVSITGDVNPANNHASATVKVTKPAPHPEVPVTG
jgi:hypothetical protein